MRQLISDLRSFNLGGVDIIGNPRSGSLIGLTGEGLEFIRHLKDCGVGAMSSYSGTDQVIVQALERGGFIDEIPQGTELKSAYVHLTHRCNLHCVGCYSLINERNRRADLPTSAWLKILDSLAGCGVRQVVFSGGEPTLRSDVVDIVAHAKGLGLMTSLITNGTISHKRVGAIFPFLDVLCISVDGYDASSSFIRDPWSPERVFEFLHEVRDAVRCHLIFTLHRQNVQHMMKYVELAGREHMSFNFSILTVDPLDPTCAPFLLQEQDLREVGRVISVSETSSVDESVLRHVDEGISGLACITQCGTAKKLISVGADGTVFPCHMLHDDRLALGNLLVDELSTILGRGRSLVHESVDDIDGCRDCEVKYLCGGGCRARSYLQHNDFSHRDPYCSMSRVFLDAQIDAMKKYTGRGD